MQQKNNSNVVKCRPYISTIVVVARVPSSRYVMLYKVCELDLKAKGKRNIDFLRFF